MPRKLHIARDGVELGTLTDRETVELLNAGFLLPSDFFWTAKMEDWKPLSELDSWPDERTSSAHIVNAAKGLISGAGEAVASKTARFTNQFRAVAEGGTAKLAESTRRRLEMFTPQIQKLVSRQLVQQSLTRVQASLRDDEFMRKLFGATYDCLPKPVHRFVSEQAFIDYCMERRSELLGPSTERSLQE